MPNIFFVSKTYIIFVAKFQIYADFKDKSLFNGCRVKKGNEQSK